MKRRLFVAILPPDEFRRELAAYGEALALPGIRRVPEENLHITLHFIGWVDELALPEVAEKVGSAARKAKPFTLRLDRVLFAPPGGPKRMIWALFHKSDSFTSLSEDIKRALQKFAGADMRKPQYPHITLARFSAPSIVRGAVLAEPKAAGRSFVVSRVFLMESKLSPSGPTYSTIESYEIV